MTANRRISTAVLGATGYVGGEFLRLIAAHPVFDCVAAVSGSAAGTPVAATFPHLGPAYGDTVFAARDGWFDRVDAGSELAVFSAAPHGASAAMIASLIDAADARNIDLHVVDASADFRFADAASWESVYGQAHGAPTLTDRFASGLPEHVADVPADHIGHPGCFATAILLASLPLVGTGIVDDALFAAAITGSTGSGRSPLAGTHHPERHSNLYAYKPLAHRHAPEVEALLTAATGRPARLAFVPHSGPFARGIHATVTARLRDGDATRLRAAFDTAYADAPFVTVVDGTPRLKDVVASNHARIGIAVDGDTAVVLCVIDNLLKGAAGGALQWMNRLWGLDETTGLDAPAPAWI